MQLYSIYLLTAGYVYRDILYLVTTISGPDSGLRSNMSTDINIAAVDIQTL